MIIPENILSVLKNHKYKRDYFVNKTKYFYGSDSEDMWEKKVKENNIEDDALNSEESAVQTDEITKDDLGSPTYEELVDINEELEKSVLRANADLDNALKRSVNEVEKAHK